MVIFYEFFIFEYQALSVAKETYVRINDEGIMCIQHQVESNKGYETYIDFLMIPEATYDHDAGENDQRDGSGTENGRDGRSGD